MYEKPKFFTWMTKKYEDKCEVEQRLVEEMKMMRHFGASPAEMAELFNMPVEWVEEFVADVKPAKTPLN